jgi:hypothetical protein
MGTAFWARCVGWKRLDLAAQPGQHPADHRPRQSGLSCCCAPGPMPLVQFSPPLPYSRPRLIQLRPRRADIHWRLPATLLSLRIRGIWSSCGTGWVGHRFRRCSRWSPASRRSPGLQWCVSSGRAQLLSPASKLVKRSPTPNATAAGSRGSGTSWSSPATRHCG